VNRPPRDRRWQSPKDRARVAAELIEEAESLSETGLIATPAELVHANRPPPIHVDEPRTAAPVAHVRVAEPAPAPDPAPAAALNEPPARVAASEPDEVTAMGIALSRRGLWAEAAAVLQRAVNADASRAAAWYYLGEALNHLDDLSGALAAFTRAAELEPAHAKSYYGQGIVLDRLNRPEEATRMYRRARDVSRR
jgi:tetratricopeptide (TPR) repeat protein